MDEQQQRRSSGLQIVRPSRQVTVDVSGDGRGSVCLDRPLQVWEVIGRALVVAPGDYSLVGAEPLQNDENTGRGDYKKRRSVGQRQERVLVLG